MSETSRPGVHPSPYEKGHSFWMTVIEELQTRAKEPTDYYQPEARTGPIALKEAVKRFANATRDVRLLSSEYFFSLDWRDAEGQAARNALDLGDARVNNPRFFCGTFWTHGWSYEPEVYPEKGAVFTMQV